MFEDQRNAEIVWNIVRRHIERADIVIRLLEHFRGDGVLTNRWANALLERAAETCLDRAQYRAFVPRNLAREFDGVFLEMREETLADIARDSQSVHRTPISEQTNRAIKILLATPIPPDARDHFKDFCRGWTRGMLTDALEWYRKETCIKSGDCLYRQLFNAVTLRIDMSPQREELLKRFYEEVAESVGTCCMGHISRLCNVMVGFDPEFDPPVPTGELLQQKIAALAERDAPVEEKVLEAWRIMDELQIPEAERTAWIDAL